MHYNTDPHAVIEGATTTTGDLIDQIYREAADPTRTLKTVVNLVTNAIDKPNESKFREFRKANAAVSRDIMSVSAACMLMRRCGFRDRGEVYRLQASGVRPGEVARLCVKLSCFCDLTVKELTAKLNASLSSLGFSSALEDRNSFVDQRELALNGRPELGRPGWTSYDGYDADPGLDCSTLPCVNPSVDLPTCFQHAENRNLGGFVLYKGFAYFRSSPGSELKLRVVNMQEPGNVLYLYEPRTPGSRPVTRAPAPDAVPLCPGILGPTGGDEEEDVELQKALRLSMTEN